jgi:hypothetical protein
MNKLELNVIKSIGSALSRKTEGKLSTFAHYL